MDSICAQHLFHPAANLFAFLAQPHHLAAQTVQFFFALFQLLAQTLRIALRRRPGLAGRLVQLNGAINFLFQRLKIVSRNLRRYPFRHPHRHGATTSSQKLGTLAQYNPEPCESNEMLKGEWLVAGWSAEASSASARAVSAGCREGVPPSQHRNYSGLCNFFSRSPAASSVASRLQKANRTCCAPSLGVVVETRSRNRCHADLFHQIFHELEVVREPECADVGHDVISAAREKATETSFGRAPGSAGRAACDSPRPIPGSRLQAGPAPPHPPPAAAQARPRSENRALCELHP